MGCKIIGDNMKWLKMRTCHSSGLSKWMYIPLYVDKEDEKTKEWVQELIEQENDEHAWSEHYRRVEYEVINTRQVPNTKIESARRDIESSIEYGKDLIEKGQKDLIEIGKLKGRGRKTDPDEIERAKRDKRFKAAMKENRKRQLSLDG